MKLLRYKKNNPVYHGLFALWLALVLALAGWAAHSGVEVSSSLFSLLPTPSQLDLQETVDKAQAQRFNRQFTLLIRQSPKLAQQAHVVDELVQSLQQHSGVLKLLTKPADFLSLRPLVPLSKADRAAIDAGQFDVFVDRAAGYLHQPIAGGFYDLIEDPFALRLQGHASSSKPALSFGKTLEVKDSSTAHTLITGTLKDLDLSQQHSLLTLTDRFKLRLQNLDSDLWRSGLVFHSAAGARQGEKEMSTIGFTSIAGIILLLWLSTRRLRLLLPTLTVMTLGLTFAMSLTILWFKTVHLIAMAFSACIFGIAIDYIIHLVSKLKDGAAPSQLQHAFPGFFLSLMTSVLAYLGIYLTPFPGLQQMAFFCVFGLIGVWLSMWLFVPAFRWALAIKREPWMHQTKYQKDDSTKPQTPHSQTSRPQKPTAVLLVGACSLFASALVYDLSWYDSPKALNQFNSPLIQEETAVQQLLAKESASQYLLVSCRQVTQCLETERQLKPLLEAQVQQGALLGYKALFQQLQPEVLQRDFQRLQRLYQQGLPIMLGQLQLHHLEPKIMQAFERIPTSSLAEHFAFYPHFRPFFLALSHLNTKHPNSLAYATLIRLRPAKQASLLSLHKQAQEFGVVFVDRIATLEQTLLQLRTALFRYLALALVGIVLFMSVRYGAQAIILTGLPFIAGSLALVILSWLGHLTIIHLIAQILVMGIGLDMTIMLKESRFSRPTWQAVHFSTVTNLLAFGLLAFCKTPALHYFGISISTGLLLLWTLVMVFGHKPKRTALYTQRFGRP